MAESPRTVRGPSPTSIASAVRRSVLNGGGRNWTFADFPGVSAGAVAHALSRLAAEGHLQRVKKGVYFRPKQTVLGPSLPGGAAILASTFRAPLHPAGLTAANVLGLTTQNPGRREYATPASAPPGFLKDARVATRRPHTRWDLTGEEGAFLEVLRDRARTSDLPAAETIARLARFLGDPERFGRLAAAAAVEPPRVRAMLGALGEQAGHSPDSLGPLRTSLNPLSRFDFGPLRALPAARDWQAK
jgi:Family of unknown function (DUF6088)